MVRAKGHRIQKADPELRRRLLWWCGIVAVVGLAIIFWGWPALKNHILTRPPEQGIFVLQIVSVFLFIPLLPMAYYLFRFARKVLSARRFPPPQTSVIRDTPIVEGPAAEKKGRLLLALSLILAFSACAGMVYLVVLLGQLASSVHPGS